MEPFHCYEQIENEWNQQSEYVEHLCIELC